MTIRLDDPRLAAELVSLVDRRVAAALAAGPVTRYGIVAAVDTASRTCSVALGASPTPSPGFAYGSGLPRVGDLVRVVVAGADRYVADNLTRADPMPFVGFRVHKSSSQTLATMSEWTRIANFTTVFEVNGVEWNQAGWPGGGWIKEPGLYVFTIAARFLNPAVTGKRLGLGWHSTTVPGAYVAGTTPPNHQVVVYGVAEANNQYESHSLIMSVPAVTGLYVFPVAWQSVSATQAVDSVLFAAAKVGDLP